MMNSSLIRPVDSGNSSGPPAVRKRGYKMSCTIIELNRPETFNLGDYFRVADHSGPNVGDEHNEMIRDTLEWC